MEYKMDFFSSLKKPHIFDIWRKLVSLDWCIQNTFSFPPQGRERERDYHNPCFLSRPWLNFSSMVTILWCYCQDIPFWLVVCDVGSCMPNLTFWRIFLLFFSTDFNGKKATDERVSWLIHHLATLVLFPPHQLLHIVFFFKSPQIGAHDAKGDNECSKIFF